MRLLQLAFNLPIAGSADYIGGGKLGKHAREVFLQSFR